MKRILLVEQDLKTLLSHHFEYAKSLSTAADQAKYSFLILGNVDADPSVCKNGVLPVLSHGRLSRKKGSSIGLLRKIDFLVNNYYCYVPVLSNGLTLSAVQHLAAALVPPQACP
jgi:hypothetical protein